VGIARNRASLMEDAFSDLRCRDSDPRRWGVLLPQNRALHRGYRVARTRKLAGRWSLTHAGFRAGIWPQDKEPRINTN